MDDREEQQIIRLLSDAATQRKGFELLVRSYSEQLYWTIRRFVLIHDDSLRGFVVSLVDTDDPAIRQRFFDSFCHIRFTSCVS